LQRERGKLDKGIKVLEKAIELHPEFVTSEGMRHILLNTDDVLVSCVNRSVPHVSSAQTLARSCVHHNDIKWDCTNVRAVRVLLVKYRSTRSHSIAGVDFLIAEP